MKKYLFKTFKIIFFLVVLCIGPLLYVEYSIHKANYRKIANETVAVIKNQLLTYDYVGKVEIYLFRPDIYIKIYSNTNNFTLEERDEIFEFIKNKFDTPLVDIIVKEINWNHATPDIHLIYIYKDKNAPNEEFEQYRYEASCYSRYQRNITRDYENYIWSAYE